MSLVIRTIQAYSEDYIKQNTHLSDETINSLNIPEELKNHIIYLQHREPIKAVVEDYSLDTNLIKRIIKELTFRKKGSEFHDLIDHKEFDKARNTLIQLDEKLRFKILKIKDKNGNTLLHKLARFISLDQDVDTHIVNDLHFENLSDLITNDHLIELFEIRNNKGQTPLHMFYCSNTIYSKEAILIETIKKIPKEKRFKILSIQDKEGLSLLHYMISIKETPDTIENYLDLLPDEEIVLYLSLADQDQQTSLHYATLKNIQRIDILLKKAKDQKLYYITLEDEDGKTAFAYAIKSEYAVDSVELLLLELDNDKERIFCLSKMDKKGLSSFIHILDNRELIKVIKDNLSKEAWIHCLTNILFHKGNNIIHIAFEDGCIETIKTLFEDMSYKDILDCINKKNSKNQTALDLIEFKKINDILKIIGNAKKT